MFDLLYEHICVRRSGGSPTPPSSMDGEIKGVTKKRKV